MPKIAGGEYFLKLLLEPASSSALAFVSTLHIALALLRRERLPPRRSSRALLLPSFALAVSPWLLPTSAGLILGLAAHLLWFVACERLLPPSTPPEERVPAAVSRRAGGASAPSTARTPGFVPTTVLAVSDETPDIRTFRLARPEGFEFHAGQFLSLRIESGGKSLVRCYTISSPPDSRRHLEISVKRQGRVSAALHDSLRPGSRLPIRGPGGRFRYPAGSERPIVLLGGGVGVTPLMSMLRHAISRETSRPVTLIYSVRTETDIAFRDELHEIGRRNPQIRVVIAVTRGGESPEYFPGRIDESLVRGIVAAPLESLYFVCGPIPMIDSMKEILSRVGVAEAHFHAEAFEAAVAWASAADSSGPGLRRSASGRLAGGESFRMNLARSSRAINVAPGQTLLEAAEQAGANIEFSCRSGVCGTCRTRLVRGEVEDDGGLDRSERDEGWILPCVALARGECELDA